MDNEMKGLGFSVWGDATEEKVKKAIKDKAKNLIDENQLNEVINGKKDKLLQVRISPEYYEYLKKLSKEKNISVSLLVREAILEYNPKKVLTEEEKEEIIQNKKSSVMARTIWTLKNIDSAMRENYNYEIGFILPDNNTLINMYDDNAFKSVKIQALEEIISGINLGNKIDPDTEKAIKRLIDAYINR